MGKVTLKFYKFNPFSDSFLVHRIRKAGWKLMEEHIRDKELENAINHSIVNLRHLIQMAGSGIKNEHDHREALEHVKAVRKRIKSTFKDLYDDMKKEIKQVEGIDLKGQTLAFRELKSVKGFEATVQRNISSMRKHALAGIKDKAKRREIEERFAKVKEIIANDLDRLEDKVDETLGHMYDLAKRQAIKGIELAAAIDSEDTDKLMRLEKVKAKHARSLTKAIHEKIRELNRLKNKDVGRYVELVKDIVNTYIRELDELLVMVRKHRFFVFDLRNRFKVLEKFAEQGAADKELVLNLEQHLKDALDEVETLYNWLYHETRKGKVIHTRLFKMREAV